MAATAGESQHPHHWLDRYATDYHRWRRFQDETSTVFARPLGLVELSFDNDGSNFKGRADVNASSTCSVQTNLPAEAIRRQILLAWAALRSQHALLRTRVLDANNVPELSRVGVRDPCFVITVPKTARELVDEAQVTITFVEDCNDTVDLELFARHAMNTARCVDKVNKLARLFVLRLEPSDRPGSYTLRTLLVAGHEILDGATCFAWAADFISLLNQTDEDLMQRVGCACDPGWLQERLPPAQEDLYPPIKSSKARQRWYWAISRILRYTRRPVSASFPNPLRRDVARSAAEAMEPLFDKVLDYRDKPLLNSYVKNFNLSAVATKTLQKWCREAKASIGAGGFALIALVMMELHEERFPEIQLADRKAWVASFPLNPRPLLKYSGALDSVMLAFSDGIALPFLPSYLPVEGRFKLLVRQAHRQLGIYQKGKRATELEAQIGSRSASQIIPSLYTSFVERVEAFRPQDRKFGYNPQGPYPSNLGATPSTCGVSSIGPLSAFFNRPHERRNEKAAFRATYHSFTACVRVRDDEFLCGTGGEPDQFAFSVAFDGNAIDEMRVNTWAERTMRKLEPLTSVKL